MEACFDEKKKKKSAWEQFRYTDTLFAGTMIPFYLYIYSIARFLIGMFLIKFNWWHVLKLRNLVSVYEISLHLPQSKVPHSQAPQNCLLSFTTPPTSVLHIPQILPSNLLCPHQRAAGGWRPGEMCQLGAGMEALNTCFQWWNSSSPPIHYWFKEN